MRILVIVSILIFTHGCKISEIRSERPEIHTYLYNNQVTFWDPYYTFKDKKVGNGLMFLSDSTLLYYSFDSNGKRIPRDYGDFMIDTVFWKVSGDSIKIDYEKFHVDKASNDSLVLSYIERGGFYQKILFIKNK